MNRRAEILQELVRYQLPTGPLLIELRSFGWDWVEDEPLLILKKDDLIHGCPVKNPVLIGCFAVQGLVSWSTSS